MSRARHRSACAALLLVGAFSASQSVVAAEAVDYVADCQRLGTAYIALPGTDTCLKISGEVRADYFVPRDQGVDDIDFRSGAILKFDARTSTEFGTLRSFVEVSGGASGLAVTKAYIQLGGLTAGWAGSAYRFFDAAYASTIFTGLYAPSHTTNRLSYTALLGEGGYATLSLEDGVNARTTITPVYEFGPFTAGYGGHELPDAVAALGVNQGWGKAQIMGAVHQVTYADVQDVPPSASPLASFSDEVGFAVGAGVGVNLPLFHGGHFAIEANYADGAMRYLGLVDPDAYVVFEGGFIAETAKGWSVASEFQAGLSESVIGTIFGSYADYNAPSFVVADYRSLLVGGNLALAVTQGLSVGAEVAYERRVSNEDAPFGGSETADTVSGGARIKRLF